MKYLLLVTLLLSSESVEIDDDLDYYIEDNTVIPNEPPPKETKNPS